MLWLTENSVFHDGPVGEVVATIRWHPGGFTRFRSNLSQRDEEERNHRNENTTAAALKTFLGHSSVALFLMGSEVFCFVVGKRFTVLTLAHLASAYRGLEADEHCK